MTSNHVLSLAALTVLDAGPAGQIQAAAEAGWRCVGLRLQPLLESDPDIVSQPQREREIRSLLRAEDISVLEIGVFPITPDFSFEHAQRVLDFSAEIGAQFTVSPIEDVNLSRRAETFARLSQLAQERGLRALAEFNPYSACRSLEEACALLEAAGEDAAGLCLDAFHLFRSGGSPESVRTISLDLFGLLHFCDVAEASRQGSSDELRRESRTARRLPGEGVAPLRELLNALPADIPVSVEAPSPRLAGLPARERAKLALEATERWFHSQN